MNNKVGSFGTSDADGTILCPCDSKYSKRYNSPFELTEKGLELGKDITKRIQTVLLELDDCLTEAERKQFYESFTKISNKLNDICEKIYKEEK